MALIIRKVNKDDISKVLDLFIAADPAHIRNNSYYLWRNFSNLFKQANSYIIENESKKVIAHYSILPYCFEWRGASILGGMAQQAVVHPDHRDLKNIFNLVNYSLKDAKNSGIDFVYGFPNEKFYFVKEKVLKWKKISRFRAKSILLDDAVTETQRIGCDNNFNFTRIDLNNFSLYKEELNKFLIDYNNANVYKEKLNMKMDVNYIKWRYFENPCYHYILWALKMKNDIQGYIVLKLFYEMNELRGHVIEMKALNDQVAAQLLKCSINYFQDIKANKLVLWDRNGLNRTFLRDINFDETFITNFYCKNLNLDHNLFCQILNLENWNIEMHYSDVF